MNKNLKSYNKIDSPYHDLHFYTAEKNMKRTYLVSAMTLFLSACFDAPELPQAKYKSSDVLVTKEQKGKLIKIVEALSDEEPKIKNLVYALSHSLNMTHAPRLADLIFSEAESMNLDVKEYLHRLTDHKDDLETIVNLSIQASVENTFHSPLIRKTTIVRCKPCQYRLCNFSYSFRTRFHTRFCLVAHLSEAAPPLVLA